MGFLKKVKSLVLQPETEERSKLPKQSSSVYPGNTPHPGHVTLKKKLRNHWIEANIPHDVVKIDTDGNCQFRSVVRAFAVNMPKADEDYEQVRLRQKVVRHLDKYWNDPQIFEMALLACRSENYPPHLKQIIARIRSKRQLVEFYAQDKQYGDENTLRGICHVTRANIHIIHKESGFKKLATYTSDLSTRAIFLLFSFADGAGHYDLITYQGRSIFPLEDAKCTVQFELILNASVEAIPESEPKIFRIFGREWIVILASVDKLKFWFNGKVKSGITKSKNGNWAPSSVTLNLVGPIRLAFMGRNDSGGSPASTCIDFTLLIDILGVLVSDGGLSKLALIPFGSNTK
ncbi:hypothetical protein HK103_007038 [Boothiomyces macroporosus]|uniref:OTU domain-containing protein n=1 Tax=Boothiomyces macroporosus TaxID=261099 RepID=A0AAD5UH13_9FUNG|nr:hypothetical protein HK103_007038 [Boothiomyces macroporosus]